MSDLAKRVADALRLERTIASDKDCHALAAFIEAAQACRNDVECLILGGEAPRQSYLGSLCDCKQCKRAIAYDAALRDLAQSMEVE